MRKLLLDSVVSLLLLQKGNVEKISSLVSSNCSSYVLKRIQTVSDFATRTSSNTSAPRLNLREQTFDVAGFPVPLPDNRKQYTAPEVCDILVNIENEKHKFKGLSQNKVINTMLKYTVSTSISDKVTALIPVGRSSMFYLLKKFKSNSNVDWAVKGTPPILPNTHFTQTISHFEKDEGRAVSNDDMKTLLKSAKQDLAKDQGNSTLIVESPTQRTINNYLALLPQLEPNRTR